MLPGLECCVSSHFSALNLITSIIFGHLFLETIISGTQILCSYQDWTLVVA